MPDVEPLGWDDGFLPWFHRAWEPGQHLSVIAPTGAGKTTLVGGILSQRRYVLALDPKGGDSTLSALGYERLTTWPGEKKMADMVARNDEEGRPSRYIVGPRVRTTADAHRLREVTRETVDGAFNMGDWTVYADELQIMTDNRMMNIRAVVDRMLIAARDKRLSLVSSYQAPSWVTPHAGKMATWVAISRTRDTDVVNRLAEILGRPKAEIRGAVAGLAKYAWLIVGRDPNEPLRFTIPREIRIPRPDA